MTLMYIKIYIIKKVKYNSLLTMLLLFPKFLRELVDRLIFKISLVETKF